VKRVAGETGGWQNARLAKGVINRMQHRNAQGLLFALCGFALLSVGDALAKSMAGLWPGPAIAALRYTVGAVGLFSVLWLREGKSGFRFPNPQLHIGRGASVAFGSAFFFVGLHFLPLAEATVVSLTSPLMVASLSAIFLRESAPKAAWIATGVAFMGVMLVLKPNIAHFGFAAFLPLGTAFLMATMIILNRKVAGTAGLVLMQFLMSAIAVPFLIGLSIAGHFSGIVSLAITMPSAMVVAKCCLMAVSATAAHSLIYAATERASAAVIAPMTYAQLFVAVCIGWKFFGEVPDRATLAGAALIVGAALYLWHSQRTR
jgi:drug/metabolite transporter (DMT)-like permease